MLDIQGRKYASVTVCDVTLYDLVTKYPVMYFDTLKVTTLEGTAEQTDIQGGKGNATLATVSHSKTINVQFDDAIMTMSSLALLTGGQLEKGATGAAIVMVGSELVEVKDGETALVLANKARKGSYAYAAKVKEGVLSTASRTTNKLTADSQSLALSLFYNTDEEEFAGQYRVFYEYEIGNDSASELTILADKFAGTYRFIGDTVLYNQYTGADEVFQIEIPRLQLDSTFSINFNAATEAVVFSFKGKALRGDAEEMLIFRQVNEEGADADSTDRQVWDGTYRELPAELVEIEEDGTITPVSYSL